MEKACKKNIFLFLFVLIFFGNCGLEDYPYIYPVPQSNAEEGHTLDSRAEVRIPNDNSGTAFTHYVIFYRIYLTNNQEISPSPLTNYNNINPSLYSDYLSIRPYIESTTLVNTNMDTFFRGKGFKYLTLEGANIDRILGSGVLGRTLVIDFSSQNDYPTLEITQNGTLIDGPYVLFRSNDGFVPLPDRYFLNSDVLRNVDNIDENTNADTIDKDADGASLDYAYASFYIVAVGLNQDSYSYIFSTPALIHTFRLP